MLITRRSEHSRSLPIYVTLCVKASETKEGNIYFSRESECLHMLCRSIENQTSGGIGLLLSHF